MAKNAPTAQHHKINDADPRSPAMKPVVVKIPVPTMLETTSAVALKNPNCRRSGDDLGSAVFAVNSGMIASGA